MPIYRDFAGQDQEKAADYVSANAAWVDGERATIGYFRMEERAHSSPHHHRDEQFLYLLKGRVRAPCKATFSRRRRGICSGSRPDTSMKFWRWRGRWRSSW